jgi:hypothetical protein
MVFTSVHSPFLVLWEPGRRIKRATSQTARVARQHVGEPRQQALDTLDVVARRRQRHVEGPVAMQTVTGEVHQLRRQRQRAEHLLDLVAVFLDRLEIEVGKQARQFDNSILRALLSGSHCRYAKVERALGLIPLSDKLFDPLDLPAGNPPRVDAVLLALFVRQ